ncbi:MAG: hypothetical protein ABI772_06095 [Bacteroidota bacterium]
MRNNLLSVISILLLITACSSKEIKQEQSITDQPAKTVVDFIKWYSNNMSRLNKIEIVNNSFDSIFDSTGLYSINFTNGELFLAELKKSGFISDAYVEFMRNYFKDCEKNFVENPQFDGPPEGFDFDLVLWSQEYDEDLKHIDKSTVGESSISSKKANIQIKFPSGSSLKYDLSLYNDKWMIDKIDNGWGK